MLMVEWSNKIFMITPLSWKHACWRSDPENGWVLKFGPFYLGDW